MHLSNGHKHHPEGHISWRKLFVLEDLLLIPLARYPSRLETTGPDSAGSC